MEPMNWTVHVRKDGCEVWTGSQVLSPARATAGGLLRYARQGRFAPGRGVRAEAERHRLPQPHRRGRVAGKAFRRLLKAAGLPGFRLYDLRHTYASLLLAAGAPITYVSAQLGHATPTTTLRYYAKWIPSKGQRWVEVLDGADLRAEANFGTRIWNQPGPSMKVVAQAAEKFGEPSRDRTEDPLIKRSSRCHDPRVICGSQVCRVRRDAAGHATQAQPRESPRKRWKGPIGSHPRGPALPPSACAFSLIGRRDNPQFGGADWVSSMPGKLRDG